MSCEYTGANLLDCRSTGGIKYFWIADYKAVASTTVTNGVVTAFTMTGSPAPKFYKFEVNPESSNYDVAEKGSADTGGIAYEQVLNLSYNKVTPAKNLIWEKLSKSRTVAIAVDFNGTAFYFGRENGLDSNGSGKIASGKKREEFNGYSVALTGKESTPLVAWDTALITGATFS